MKKELENNKSELDCAKTEDNAHVHVRIIESAAKHTGRGGWWSRRSCLEQLLLLLCTFLLLACVALLTANILHRGRQRKAEGRANETCLTPECIQAASRLLSRMDARVAPCGDFYGFACGRWLERNTVPDDHHMRSTIQTMQDELFVALKKLIEEPSTDNDTEAILKLKRFYTSCMNVTSVEEGGGGAELRALLSADGVGAWPLLEGVSWAGPEAGEDWLEWRLAVLLAHSVHPFFHAFVAPDDRNASLYLLHVYSGSPVLSTSYYVNASAAEHARHLAAYRDLVAETARLLDARGDHVDQDVDDLINFETRFANLTADSYAEMLERMESNETSEEEFAFNKLNVSALETLIPEIKWRTLLGYAFDSVGVSLDVEQVTLVMHCEKFLRHLVHLIDSTPPRTVCNYVTWRLVARYLPYLESRLRRAWADFRARVPLPLGEEGRPLHARWKECLQASHDGFGMALAALYAATHTPPEHSIEVLIGSLKRSFISGIRAQAWLDPDTKALCEEKVEVMNSKIGFPKYILDPVQLDADYSGLEISEDHFLKNILKMNRFEVRKELNKISRTVDKERDWFVQPLVVNAYYEATGNAVIFPAGILRYPIFMPDRPKYLNYGMFGVVIGHEITHGFDTGGRKFDKAGNMSGWWGEESLERFKERAACYVDQYAALPIDMVAQNVNGNQTLDDNICDNSALKQAYRAYLTDVSENGEEPRLPGVSYSNEQIFFLQYAQIWCEVLSKESNERYIKDSHSPGQYRANVPLMNSPEFAAVFECPLGSPMNPEKKCSLWG